MQDKLFFVYLPVFKSSLNIFWAIYCMYRLLKYIYTVITSSVTTGIATPTINYYGITTAATETIPTRTTATLPPHLLTDNIPTDGTTTNNTDQQITDYGPLHEGIIVLKDWIQQNGLNKLSALSSPLVGMQSYTMFAKDVLLELVTTDRSSRLQALINYISDKDTNEEESNRLAAAMASIMMMCFENVLSSIRDEQQKSPFYDALPMLTNAIRACPDTFIYDFMLFNITNASTTTAVLKQDLDGDGNNMLTNNKKKLNSDIINEFLENNDFMVASPLPTNDGSVFSNLSKRVSEALKKILGCGLLEKDAQLIMFEHYAERTLSTINQIKGDLWDTDLFGPNVAPPAIPPSPPPSAADSIPSYSTGTPPSLSASDSAYTAAPTSVDVETIVPRDNYGYEQDAGEYEKFKRKAHLRAKFQDEVLTLRNRSISIQPRIETLLTNMDTLNNTHKLSKMGLTLPRITKRIIQLQKAFRSLITSFQQHREYVFEYEKGFTFYQVYKFVDRFRDDAENYRDDFRGQIRQEPKVNVDLFVKLERKSDLFISMSYNLKTTLQRFVDHDLDYHQDYTSHATKMHNKATLFATTYGNEFCTRLFSERIFSETYHQHENSRIFRNFPQVDDEQDMIPFVMNTSYYNPSELAEQQPIDELILPQQPIGETQQLPFSSELIGSQQPLGEPIPPSEISSFDYRYRAENFSIPPFARNFRELEQQQQTRNQQNGNEDQQQSNNDEDLQQNNEEGWHQNNGDGWQQSSGDGWQ